MPKKPLAEPMPFESPFAKLDGLRSQLRPGPPSATAVRPAAKPTPARAVVRIERKGHGGKEMTRVEHLGLSATMLEVWLGDLKRGLGCGGTVDGGDLLLQGDQRERAMAWLDGRGVGKVTRG
jgi:translation initiation factor 1